MIKAATRGREGEFDGVILGISRGNWNKLIKGQPILVKLRDLHPDLPDIAVTLLGGETEQDIMEDLRVLGPIRPNPHDTEPEGR